MAIAEKIRVYGAKDGAAGIKVTERIGVNVLSQAAFGSVLLVGDLKRGPVGVPIPLYSRKQYDEIYGKPGDRTWHLYPESESLLPDAIDGFYQTSAGAGTLWLVRNALEGKGKIAKLVATNRDNIPVLEISAANMGRWAGFAQKIDWQPIVYATATSFTIVSPGVEKNEFVGAEISFSAGSGKNYIVVSNTEANSLSGETTFFVSPHIDLQQDGISGPAILTGAASYTLQTELTGTVAFDKLIDVAGTVTISGIVVTGLNTVFQEELAVGDILYYNGEGRSVTSITSNTTLTVDEAYTSQGSGLTVQRDNLIVEGTGTAFDLELQPGDVIFVTSDGSTFGRTVAQINRNSLTGTIACPLTRALTGTVDVSGTAVTGTGTAFTTELTVGDHITIGSETAVVTAITDDTHLTLDIPLTPSTGASAVANNKIVTGTGTAFSTQLATGSTIIVTIGGTEYIRTVASVTDNTHLVLSSSFPVAIPALTTAQALSGDSLTLESGFPVSIAAGTSALVDNYWVEGVDTNFAAELSPGDYIIDPNRSGATVQVAAIDTTATPERFKVSEQFAGGDFTNAQIVRQTQKASIELVQPVGKGLAVQFGLGIRFPQTHFSMNVFFDGTKVLSIPDASLDPADNYFIEPLVNEGADNVAYRTGDSTYATWITIRSLFTGAYTTAPTNDVRPNSGAGKILFLTAERAYTIGDFDYDRAIGGQLYPDPYRLPRTNYRIIDAQSPVTLEGTVSTIGTSVYGSATNFLTSLNVGDYIYDPATEEARLVTAVLTDTAATILTPFDSDMDAGTVSQVLGYLSVDRGTNLLNLTSVGTTFFASFPEVLSGGYDGDIGSQIPYHTARYFNMDDNILEEAIMGHNQGLVRMATPGKSDPVIDKSALEYASNVAWEYRVEIPSWITSASVAERYINEDIGRSNYMSVGFPSYGKMANPLGQGERLISLSGDIMGLESQQAVLHEGWHFPAAGVDAALSRVLRLTKAINPKEEALLNLAGIQPIKYVSGNAVIFGARVPSIDSIFDFLHIRRQQSHYARLFMEARPLLAALFKPNQPELAEQLIMVLENFARNEYRKGVYSRYLTMSQAVTVSSFAPTNNSAISTKDEADIIVKIINGELVLEYSYVPTGIVERLNLVVGPDILVSSYGERIKAA